MSNKERSHTDQRLVMFGGGGSTLDFVTPGQKARLEAKAAKRAVRKEKIGNVLAKAKVLFKRG